MTEINSKTHYPVDCSGNMLEEVRWCWQGGAHSTVDPAKQDQWKQMEDFTAKLRFVRWQKGRSSLRFIVADSEGKTYSMMSISIEAFVKNSICGNVKGTWEFVKRGSYYGIQLKEIWE